MQGSASVVHEDADDSYLADAALYYALPAYADLVDIAASAEMKWLNAKATGSGADSKQLLEAYTASLAPRRCRLFGTLLVCAQVSGGHSAHVGDLYVKIRLSAPSATYRDRIYECHYCWSSVEWAPNMIRDLSETKIGDDIHLLGRLERSFAVPGFYLARARLYRGPKRND